MRLSQWPARAPHKESMAAKVLAGTEADAISEFALQVDAAIDRQPAGPAR